MSVKVADGFRCHCSKCIDFHAHFLHRQVFDECHPWGISSCFGRSLLSPQLPSFQPMFHPELQIKDMDERGIDINVLTSCDVLQSRTWTNPDNELRMNSLVNEECMRWVQAHPRRFIGTAVLPLGNMRKALDELNWARSAGLRIVQLPSNYRGHYLGSKRFIDLWAEIHEYRMIAFIHPDGVTDTWFQDYALWNSIGQSIEEVKVMSSLIYEGVLDRFPGLKIVMAHGGGYMPHYMGRLDRNVTDKPYTTKNITKMPSEYLSDFYYDSCVYDARTLEILIERVGIDRVLMGGDYPVAAVDPIDFLTTVRIPREEQAKIAGGNADRLLELS